MSQMIEIDLTAVKQISNAIQKITSKDRSNLLGGISGLIQASTEERLDSEGGTPDGQKWKPLQHLYATKKKKKSSGGILSFSGHLRDSITSDFDVTQVTVGSNLVYAAVHNEGSNKMPQRQWLGLGSDDITDISELVADYFDECVRG